MPRTVVWTLGLILVIALALRLLHLYEIMQDILYQYPILDEEYYYRRGAWLAAGQAIDLPFWRPPGLTLALGVILKLFGDGPLAPRLVQVLLSTATVGLVFLVGRRLLSTSVALVAAGMVALHVALIDFSVALKATTWAAFLDVGALWCLSRTTERGSRWWFLAAGGALGISAWFRPGIVAFVPFVLLWIALGRDRRRLMVGGALLILGLAIPLVPVSMVNSRAAGTPMFLSTNGGMNFWIGNHPDYRTAVVARPGADWDQLILGPALAQGLTEPSPQRDRFYYHRAWQHLRDDPATGVARFARKLYLFANGHEIPRDADLYDAMTSSRVLRALGTKTWPRPPTGILIPLALLGLLVCAPQHHGRWLLGSFLLVQAVTVAAFFVSARYRVPALPVIALFAAGGTVWLAAALRARRGRGWVGLAGVLALMVVLNLPTFETRQSLAAERLYFRGNAWTLEGNPVAAVKSYREAILLDADDVRPWRTLSERLMEQGDLTGAADARREALLIAPDSQADWDHLVELQIRMGNIDDAVATLRENAEIRAGTAGLLPRNLFRIAVLEYERGRYDASLAAHRECRAADPAGWSRILEQWTPNQDPTVTSRGSRGHRAYHSELRRLREAP